jgi:HK97 family phage portal protein
VASLVTAGGRLLRRTAPGAKFLQNGSGFVTAGPVWSNGDNYDAYGLHTPAGYHLASYAEIYETQPVVAAAVNKLTRQLSTLPLKLYKLQADNDRERVVKHPLADLFRLPCPDRSVVDLLQWISLPLLVHGNALLVKYREKADGPVTELLPMDWRYVSAWAQQGGPVEWWETNQTGERRFVHASEAIHFAWHSPSSIVGTSPLQQLGVTLQSENAAQRYSVNSFRNGIRPSLALELPLEASHNKEIRDAIREEIQSVHGGPDNIGKAFIAGGGAVVKPLSFSAREATLVETRQLSREEVAMVYDVKPTVLGDLTHGTYSNVSELNKDFYKTTLRPWLVLIEETFKSQLIEGETSFEGVFPEFDLSEQLKGDPLELAQSLRTEIESGTLTPNEARRIQNRPADDTEDADKLYLPKNNLQALGEEPPEPVIPTPMQTVKDVVRDPNTKRIAQIKEREEPA